MKEPQGRNLTKNTVELLFISSQAHMFDLIYSSDMYPAQRLERDFPGVRFAEFKIPDTLDLSDTGKILPFRKVPQIHVMGIEVSPDQYPLPPKVITYKGLNTVTPSMVAQAERANLTFLG